MGERIVHEGDPSSHNTKDETNNAECENYFHFMSEPPTLLNIASVSTAIQLWIAAGMKEFLENQRQNADSQNYNFIRVINSEYRRLEDRALKKVNDLVIPEELKLNISHCMKPIGLQLQKSLDRDANEFSWFFDLYMKGGSLYWTMQGVVDQIESLKELIKSDVNGEDFHHWYTLACNYCVEESVSDLWMKIPSNKNMIVDTACKSYHHHILAYWAALQVNELSGLLTKLMPNDNDRIYSSDLGIYENMVSLSIHVENLFALKYFWHKLSNHEKNVIASSNIVENWIIKLSEIIKRVELYNDTHTSFSTIMEYQTYDVYTEMLCFLFARVKDSEKQKQIFQDHSIVFLKSLLIYWPSQMFFLPAMVKMMVYIPIDIYTLIMTDLARLIKDGLLTGEQFKTIWRHSPLKFQGNFILALNSKPWLKLSVTSSLLTVGDLLTICSILENDPVDVRKTFVTKLIKYKVERLAVSNKLIYADELLSRFLPDCDIVTFKQRIMMTCASKLCYDCITSANCNAAEKLLKWGFQSPSQIEDFKRNQLNSNEIFISLIYLNKFDQADLFLSWYFESANEVCQFKKAFISDDNIFYCEKLLFRLSSDEEDGWITFEEKFLNYCSCSPENVEALKKLVVKEAGHIVEAHHFTFASKLLNWCLGSADAVNQFKNELMLSRRGIDIILNAMQDIPYWGKTKRVLKWFSPLSSEVVAKLKCTLTTNEFKLKSEINVIHNHRSTYSPENQRLALFYLLDFFVVNYTEHDFDIGDDYDWNVNDILDKDHWIYYQVRFGSAID